MRAAAAARSTPTPRHWAERVVGALLLALLANVGSAAAAPPAAVPADPGQTSARTDEQWLRTIQAAAERQTYSGTIIYQQGEEVRATRLVHVFDGSVSRERLQPLDGRPREFISRADEVQCLIPDSHRVVIERRLAKDAFPGLASADPAEILKHYKLRLGSVERVAGVDCQVIHVEPMDKLRYGYRLCVDRATGLLLRAMTLSDRKDVLEQMAFAEVRIGENVNADQLKPSWDTAGWRVERSDQPSVDLAGLGWHVAPPAGFHKLREVMRSGWGHVADRKAMQAIFTDGLANVSVFIEPSAPAGAAEAAQSNGPTSVYARRVGDARVTVVGEVPMSTVKALAKSIEYRAPR
jgi:sigma-E factor negative regulatory protein RseB